MVDLQQEFEVLKERFAQIKSRPTLTAFDHEVAKNDYMITCMQALELLDKALHQLETPPDYAFWGDEGIK